MELSNYVFVMRNTNGLYSQRIHLSGKHTSGNSKIQPENIPVIDLLYIGKHTSGNAKIQPENIPVIDLLEKHTSGNSKIQPENIPFLKDRYVGKLRTKIIIKDKNVSRDCHIY